jgi:hypothetical protein
MEPLDASWRAESWFLPAARRARQLDARAAEAVDGRLALDDDADGSPSGGARSPGGPSSALDALLDGADLSAVSPALGAAVASPAPRALGLRREAAGDVGGGVPAAAAPAPWSSRWPKIRTPGPRFARVDGEGPVPGAEEALFETRDDASPDRAAETLVPSPARRTRAPRAARPPAKSRNPREDDRDHHDASSAASAASRLSPYGAAFAPFATPAGSSRSSDAPSPWDAAPLPLLERAPPVAGLGAPWSPPFDRAIRHRFDARCRYDAKEETAEERSRRRRGGNAAAFESAREARVRKAREKAKAVEAIGAARARRTRASGEEPDENDAPGTRATRDG